MNTIRFATLFALFGITFFGTSAISLRAETPDDPTPPVSQKYRVPLLEYPAFLEANSATGDGTGALLKPVSEVQFGRSLGAQYWTPGKSGWPAMLGGEDNPDENRSRTANGSFANDADIFRLLPMGDARAIPDVSAKKTDDPHIMTGAAGLFSESAQHPRTANPQGPPWAVVPEGTSAVGVTGGIFLILALFGLLFSQLRGFEKRGRRRRTSTRRRR